MNEQWKPVPGFAGYEVSDHGSVRSFCRTNGVRIDLPPRLLKFHTNKKTRYLMVRLRGKLFAVHQVVIMSFVGPAPKGCVCRHFDDDKTNNCLGNLRWGTRLENAQDAIRNGWIPFGSKGGNAKLTESQVADFFHRRANGEKTADIAQDFNVSKWALFKILEGKSWKHVS